MRDKFVLRLQTHLPAESLQKRLKAYEPWSHRIDFDNGVSTKDLQRRVPFSENTLQKFSIVAEKIPFEQFREGHILDIGCNSGYNSIFAATHFDMRPVGIDVSKRHIEVSTFLSEMAGVSAEFLRANAETFSRPAAFDVALHFGTLYHLKNPILSLENTYKNLKTGGYLALETQVYEHPDDENVCYFMYMHNDDHTNFWALSPQVLTRLLEIIGFSDIQILFKAKPKMLGRHMSRIILVARKPDIPEAAQKVQNQNIS
jgi:SAM-dependent methyltransferase